MANATPTLASGSGKVRTDLGFTNDSGNCVIVQADGKILVAGSSGTDFALARYNANGTLDTSFGSGGKTSTHLGSAADDGRSVSVQPDGKVLVAGYSGTDFAVARYNSNGSLDTSFGSGGKVTTASSIYDGFVSRVLANGSIQLGGYNYHNGNSVAYALVTYNSNGGMSSIITASTRDNSGFVFSDGGRGVATQSDGKVLVAGSYGGDFALLRYNADRSNPTLDASFGSGGKVISDLGSTTDSGRSVAVQADGKILVAGSSAGDFALARFNADGSPDTAFNGSGKVITDLGSNSDYGQSVAVQTDGKILVSGSSNGDFALVRYNSDGSLDNTFGGIPVGLSLSGGSGNDTLQGGSGNDTLDGGSGFDSVLYSDSRAHYLVTKTATGFTVKDNTGSDGTDTLSNIEQLKFSDMTVNLTIQAKAAAAPPVDVQRLTELYVAFFNRVPDADGLAYWIDQMSSGQSINQIAESFYNAGVLYSNLTGYSASMSNQDFVNVLYRNVLGRTSGADAEGLAYWSGKLAAGQATHGSLVSDILSSAHTFKGEANYGWVADLLDNKITVANKFAIDLGLNYNTANDSISHGMAIAAAVTATATTDAIALIGIPGI